MRAAVRPTLLAPTGSVCWYQYRAFWMTSRLISDFSKGLASAKLFECDFSIKLAAMLGAGFSSVLRTPSRQLSAWPYLYETAIDVKVFARHPPCREPFLEALPNGAARELR